MRAAAKMETNGDTLSATSDVIPAVLATLAMSPSSIENKIASKFMNAIYKTRGAEEEETNIMRIAHDKYRKNIKIVFASDVVISTCDSIHQRPLGACINLYLVEDVSHAASVIAEIECVLPRVATPRVYGQATAFPRRFKIQREFKDYQFDSDIDISAETYQKLIKSLNNLRKHANDQLEIETNNILRNLQRDELTRDVNMLLNSSQTQMRMGAIHAHLVHIVENSASIDMLSTLDEIRNTPSDMMTFQTAMDVVVKKQLEQWLPTRGNEAASIKYMINTFENFTKTPTQYGGLSIMQDGQRINIGGIIIVNDDMSLGYELEQCPVVYKRALRSIEIKEKDYKSGEYSRTTSTQTAFPEYTLDSKVIIKEHRQPDTTNKREDGNVAITDIHGMATKLRYPVNSGGALLVDNISSIYNRTKDEKLNPLRATLTHTTQCTWNLMNGLIGTANPPGDFYKSEKLNHVYMDIGTPDLYLCPSDTKLQCIRADMIKNTVFNDPHIYSDHFVDCFNEMYKYTLKLGDDSPTKILFKKISETAGRVYSNAHDWHRKNSKKDFTQPANGYIIMSELHPYFDVVSSSDRTKPLKAIDRMVHGNMPLYIRPTASMILAGEALSRNIWGASSQDRPHETTKIADKIHQYFVEAVPESKRACTHMLYAVNEKPDSDKTTAVSPVKLINKLCAFPLIKHGTFNTPEKIKYTDSTTKKEVHLQLPESDEPNNTEAVPNARFFYTLDDKDGETTFKHIIRPPFHELMKEIKASPVDITVKMCAMFCAWIRLTPQGTNFAFLNSRWPLAATVLTFKEDETAHAIVSRQNSIISLSDAPLTAINTEASGKVTIESTAKYKMSCDGTNPNSVIALHAFNLRRNNEFRMVVATTPSNMKNVKIDDKADEFDDYKLLVQLTERGLKRTRETNNRIAPMRGKQLAWVCPPVVPSTSFQTPTNPTGRSSLPSAPDVDGSVDIHDPTKDNGTGVSTLNPYATLPGGYVFCLHANPRDTIGEITVRTYKSNDTVVGHFFAPVPMLMQNKVHPALGHKIFALRCNYRLFDNDSDPLTKTESGGCNSLTSRWSEMTGLAQHEVYASDELMYNNVISQRQADSTYASRRVEWRNHSYAVLGQTFYDKHKAQSNFMLSGV